MSTIDTNSTYSGAPDECSIHWPEKLPCSICGDVCLDGPPNHHQGARMKPLTLTRHEDGTFTVRHLHIRRTVSRIGASWGAFPPDEERALFTAETLPEILDLCHQAAEMFA